MQLNIKIQIRLKKLYRILKTCIITNMDLPVSRLEYVMTAKAPL